MNKKKKLFFVPLCCILMIIVIAFTSIVSIRAKKVFAAENELKIIVNDVENVTVDFSEDGKFHCRYNHSLYIVKRKQKDSVTVINVKKKKGKKKNTTTIEDIKLYIPDKTYTKITGIAKQAGLFMPSANANITVKNYSGAVNLKLPTGFHKKIKYIGKKGAGSINMNGNDEFMIDVEASGTALSTFWGGDFNGDAVYQYQHGDGKKRPKIQLDLEGCSFSIIEK